MSISISNEIFKTRENKMKKEFYSKTSEIADKQEPWKSNNSRERIVNSNIYYLSINMNKVSTDLLYFMYESHR